MLCGLCSKLEKINNMTGLYQNMFDFAIYLFLVNLADRAEWLKKKVAEKSDSKEVFKLIEEIKNYGKL